MTKIPSPDEIEPEWLSQVLSANGYSGAVVAQVSSHRIGTGQAAACSRLHMTYVDGKQAGAPATLVAKFPSEDETSRKSCMAMGLYQREVDFYRDVAPRLTLNLPRTYFLEVSDSGEFFLILMEDLSPAEQGDQLAGCSPTVAREAVLQLVGLQAPVWCDAALGARFMDKPGSFFADMRKVYNDALPGFLDRLAHRLDPEEVAIIADLGKSTRAPLYLPVGSPFCLEHRDFRPDNVMSDMSRSEPKIITVDWQGMRTGRPLNDVCIFLGAGVEPEVRREIEGDLIREYHSALVAAGVRDFSWEQCWLEYRRAAYAGFALTVISTVSVVQTDRGDAMFTAMARRYARHALEVGARDFL